MTSRNAAKHKLLELYVTKARAIAPTVRIAVICSVRGKTNPSSDYDRQSIDSRFYSLEEADEFLASLRRAGFLVVPFFSENEFITWVLEGHYLRSEKRLLVVSTGSSFSGVGSKSLIPAFCALHHLYNVGPDTHIASLARHKYHTNLILRSLGDVVPESWFYDPQTGWVGGITPSPGRQIILKPAHEGASIGIDENSTVIVDQSLTNRVVAIASEFRQPVVLQEFIPGYEIEVPLFCTPKPQAMIPVGISVDGSKLMAERVLTYAITKSGAYGFWNCESKLPVKTIEYISHLAEACADILSLRDLARVDFRVTAGGSAKVIDISTSPYLSSHTSFAFATSACGAAPSDLPVLLVGLAAARLGLIDHPQ